MPLIAQVTSSRDTANPCAPFNRCSESILGDSPDLDRPAFTAGGTFANDRRGDVRGGILRECLTREAACWRIFSKNSHGGCCICDFTVIPFIPHEDHP